MELKPFIKKTVSPGEPLTAQAWNDVVEAVDNVHQFLRATLHVVRVKITNPGIDPESVRVTATRAAGAPIEAVRPVPPSAEHTISGLELGAWTIVARAPNFQTATQSVDVAETGETALEIALQPAGVFMPDVFGKKFNEVSTALGNAGIPLVRVLDFTGRDLPPSSPGLDALEAPVLVQYPAAGTAIPTGGGASLVLGVPIEVEPAVEVPSLAGLTQAEAQKALEAIGLTLGKITIMQKQP